MTSWNLTLLCSLQRFLLKQLKVFLPVLMVVCKVRGDLYLKAHSRVELRTPAHFPMARVSRILERVYLAMFCRSHAASNDSAGITANGATKLMVMAAKVPPVGNIRIRLTTPQEVGLPRPEAQAYNSRAFHARRLRQTSSGRRRSQASDEWLVPTDGGPKTHRPANNMCRLTRYCHRNASRSRCPSSVHMPRGPSDSCSSVATSAADGRVQRDLMPGISSRALSRRVGAVAARGAPVKHVGGAGTAVSCGKLQSSPCCRCVSNHEGTAPGEKLPAALFKAFRSTEWAADVGVVVTIKCVMFSMILFVGCYA
eukprot:57362_1